MNSGWTFSSRQRRGILLLAALLVIVVLGRIAWTKLSEPEAIDFDAPAPYIAEEDSTFKKKKGKEPSDFPKARVKKQMPAPGSIDLNKAAPSDLEKLPGIGPTFSQRIVRYRDAIGGFDSVAQLQKVYGLPPETYENVKSVFYLSSKPEKASEEEKIFTKDSVEQRSEEAVELQVIDLNQADSAALDQLPGIGPVLSARIVKFRERLGYFTSKDMLELVYGFSEENREKALPWLEIKATPEPLLSLQTADWKTLRKLAFLEKESIDAILKRQRSKVPFNNWEEVAAAPGHGREATGVAERLCCFVG
jgi:competence protein ComEA